jgi:hypothetical protein
MPVECSVLQDLYANCVFFSAQLCEDVTAELMPFPLIINGGDLEQDSRVEKCFYLRAHRVGNRNITVKVGQLDLALDCSQFAGFGVSLLVLP